jgi:hypothetical protein
VIVLGGSGLSNGSGGVVAAISYELPRRRCESDPVAHGNEYYFCLNHHRVEGAEGCSAPQRLGPYPDEATAARALEIVQERNEAADEYDES